MGLAKQAFQSLMKFSLLIFIAIFVTSSHAAEVTFAKQHPSESIIAMIQLSQGDYIGSSIVHENPTLIRFDENGSVISAWEYVVLHKFRTVFEGLIETSDFEYVAFGSVNFKNPIIVRFDSNGLPQWKIAILGKYKLNSISNTADGGFIAVGHLGKTNSVESDAWIIKLNRVGRVVWSKLLEEKSGDRFQFVQQTEDGGYVVVGTLDDYQITTEPKVIVAKLSAHGELIWNHIYSSTELSALTGATLTSGQGLVLVGNVVGGVFVMKVGSNGGIHWAKAFFNRPHALMLSSVVRAKDSGYVAAGSSDQFRGPDNRGLLLKVNSSGKLEWSRRTSSQLFSVEQTSDSGFILTGSGVNFNGILKTNARGFIPECSLLRRFPLSAKTLQIKQIREANLKLKSVTVQAESFSITTKNFSVEDEDYCH